MRAFLILLATSRGREWCDSHRDTNCIAPSVISGSMVSPFRHGFGRIFPRLERRANSERRKKTPHAGFDAVKPAHSHSGELVKGALMSFIHLALRGVATRHLTSSSLTRFSKSRIPQRMTFSAASTLDKAQVETRVLDVLKSFEKVHPEKV